MLDYGNGKLTQSAMHSCGRHMSSHLPNIFKAVVVAAEVVPQVSSLAFPTPLAFHACSKLKRYFTTILSTELQCFV